MPNSLMSLPQPVFDESIVTADPAKFKTDHPSDNQQYAAIQALLKTKVVGFAKSRLKPDGMFSLVDALGPHGPESVKKITDAGQIVFHAIGDTGASDPRAFKG